MGVFDNILHSDQTLFKNIDALDFAFIPKIVPYREDQQRKMANAIQPLFQDRNGKNLLLYGLPGVGKTVACKHVLQELEEKTDEIVPLYINCWQKNTSYKIVMQICEDVGYRFTQNKKTDELFNEVIKILNKKKIVLVFDEIDKAEEHNFLYIFIEEIYRKTIILITNFRTFMEEMDERVKSRLMPELVEFKPYNFDETTGILKDRVRYSFYPNVWESNAFDEIVKKTATMQDIRVGIQLLKDAGDIAESKSQKIIRLEHAKEAIAKIDDFETLKSSDLNDEDRFIMSIIKKNSKSKIGDLFKIYTDTGGKSVYKTFQRKMKMLEEQGFVKLMKSHECGNTTIVEYKERMKSLNEF